MSGELSDLTEIVARAHFQDHASGPCDLTPAALERIADAVATVINEVAVERDALRAAVARVKMQGLRPIDLRHARPDCVCSGFTLEAACVAASFLTALTGQADG